jgi:multiple sugar transport system substrate-binding protein
MEENMKRIRDLRPLLAVILVIGAAWRAIPSQASSVHRSHSNASVSVRMAYFGGPDTKKLLDQITPKYQKAYKGVSVVYEPEADRDKQVIAIAAGTAPDVFMLGDGDVRWYEDKNALANLTPYMNKDKFSASQYLKGTLVIGTSKNKIYALPKDYSTIAVYYNKDMFRAAGVPFPKAGWTLNQFRADAVKLTKNGNYGASLSGDWVREVDPFVRELGGHLDNSNGTKTVGFMNSAATVKAVQWWVDLFLKYKISPTPAAAKSLGVGDLFASGKAAMNVTGVWPSLGTAGYPNTLKFNWGVAPFPTGPNANHVNTICWAGFAMSKTTKHPQQGWGLVKYMAGPVGDQIWGTAGGLPAIKAVATKFKVNKNPISGVFLKEAKFTELPSDINGPAAPQAVSDTLSEGLDLLLNTPNAGTTQQVLTIEAQKGQKAINAYYGR